MQIDQAMTVEQARHLHRNVPTLALGGFAGASIVAILLRDIIPPAHLIVWVMAYGIFAAYRMAVWSHFRAAILTCATARRFFKSSFIGAAIGSCLWAAAMFFFFPECPPPQQVIFFCMIILVAVSAMFGLDSHYPSFVGSFLPFSVSAVFIMASYQTIFYAPVLPTVAFIPMMLLFAWRFHRLLLKSLRLRFENLDLVEQLTIQKEAAEAATHSKSRFLAAASHDLRQPMHALNLYLGVLAGSRLPECTRPLLAKIRQSAQMMDDMFRALLEISRLDAGVVRVDFKVFPIAPLLDQVSVEFEPQAHVKGLTLHVAPCSAYVRSDPALVERILRNLVSNAVRYTVQGKILVGCRRKGNHVTLAVYDTGPGIDRHRQKAVFEEFYQIGNPERDRTQGLGLGLTIAQRLTHLLGTHMVLASSLERGSVFSFDLPCAPAAEASPNQVKPNNAELDNLRGALIAVVDDEVAILDAMQHLLEQWGCIVITASSGKEAVEMLGASERVPDALVCDYRLRGEETGVHVVEILRNEFNHDIPALLVTGDTAPDRLRQTEASGLAVLHKPLQEHVLREALSRLISAG